MATVRIEVKFNKLPQCPGIMEKAVATAFGDVGPKLLSTMKGKTPVDTGELRNSESMSVGSKQLTLSAGTDHCGFVEFGTRKMAAQPYMRPTVEGAGGQIASAITSAVSGAFG